MDKNDKIYLDKKGYDLYLKEIDELRDSIINIGKDKSEAYSNGVGDGWHDNFAFEEAKREELRIQKLLRDKIEGLSRIVIVEGQDILDVVDIDDYVKFTMNLGGTIRELITQLVGHEVKDVKNEVSLSSPLGKALYHKKIGDKVNYEINGNVISIEILDISKTKEFHIGLKR